MIKIHSYKFFHHLFPAKTFVSTECTPFLIVLTTISKIVELFNVLRFILVVVESQMARKPPHKRLETIRLGITRLFPCWRESLFICREFNDTNKQFRFLKRSKKLFPPKAMLLLMSQILMI